MQEEQTVSFEPMSVGWGPVPWHTRLFALYLLFIFALLLVRIVKLVANLRNIREAREQSTPATLSDLLLADCYAKTKSLRDFCALTFLISLLNFGWSAANDFLSLLAEKTASVPYVLARIGEELIPFLLGLIFCIVLLSAAMLFEAALRHRRFDSSTVPNKASS